MSENQNPKVVVLGGGTGMPILLEGLKSLSLDLSTVVTVADDGGSTGKIREEIEIPAPGDIRNVIATLAEVDDELIELFQHRFTENNPLAGHSLGNLVLAAMNDVTGDFYHAVKQVARLFCVEANIYPISNKSLTLHAELNDGTIVSGESNIPVKNKKIERVFLTPETIEPNPEVVQAIMEADMIVISPGSLYTSILANLIASGVQEALQKTSAKVVYVCNIMTQEGETNDYSAMDHVQAIFSHIGEGIIDTIIVHNKPIDREMLCKYSVEDSVPVVYKRNHLEKLHLEVIEANILDGTHEMIRHDTTVLAEILYELAIIQKSKDE